MRSVLFVALLLAVAETLPAQVEAERTFTLHGQVLDVQSDAPVEGAVVEVRELRRRVIAGANGKFTVPDLPEGSYTFVTGRLGYATNVEVSEVRAGNVLVVRLLPQAIPLAEIRVAVDRLEIRRKSVGFASWAGDHPELATSTASTVAAFIKERYGVEIIPCSGREVSRNCATFRSGGFSGARPYRLFVDDMHVPNGDLMLDSYRPGDLYRVEVYPGLGQIRIYTPYYIEHVVRGGNLPAICIVC